MTTRARARGRMRVLVAVGGLAGCGPTVTLEGDGTESATSGEGSTSADATMLPDSSGAPLQGWCLETIESPEPFPHASLLDVLDSDGNGRDELWFSSEVVGPDDVVEAETLRVYALDEADVLSLLAERELDGDLRALVHLDDDPWPDALMARPGTDERWWLAGLSGYDFDPSPRPLQAIDRAIWIDANRDGMDDAFVAIGESYELWLGDGTGAFAFTDEISWGLSHAPGWIWPVVGLPGQLLVVWQLDDFGFRTDLWAIEVSAGGNIEVLRTSGRVEFSPLWVQDFDGDGIGDAHGTRFSPSYLSFAQSNSVGYEFEDLALPFDWALAGDFDDDGVVDLLHVSQGIAAIRLHEDGIWPESLEVTQLPPWRPDNQRRVFQADGEGAMEIASWWRGDDPGLSWERLLRCDL